MIAIISSQQPWLRPALEQNLSLHYSLIDPEWDGAIFGVPTQVVLDFAEM